MVSQAFRSLTLSSLGDFSVRPSLVICFPYRGCLQGSWLRSGRERTRIHPFQSCCTFSHQGVRQEKGWCGGVAKKARVILALATTRAFFHVGKPRCTQLGSRNQDWWEGDLNVLPGRDYRALEVCPVHVTPQSQAGSSVLPRSP